MLFNLRIYLNLGGGGSSTRREDTGQFRHGCVGNEFGIESIEMNEMQSMLTDSKPNF